jgi:hypothetical protein
MEDENELCILEEWDTRENLNSHLKSERFKVLRGAMNLLQEPYEMMFHTVAAGKRERKRGPRQKFSDRDDCILGRFDANPGMHWAYRLL